MFNSDGFQGLGGDTTFRDHPQSELTFSDSTGVSYMALSQQNNFHLQSRLYQPAEVTTSDRLVVVSPPTTVMPHFSGDFASSLYSQSLEIGDVVQFQRLQSGMELLRGKHCRHLLSEVKQQAMKSLRVKEVELEILNQRNIELEEQLRQMSAECQVWFDYAKRTESVVSGLREELEFVLTNKNTCPAVGVEEGYGDNVGMLSLSVKPVTIRGPAWFAGRRRCAWCCSHASTFASVWAARRGLTLALSATLSETPGFKSFNQFGRGRLAE